MTYQARNTTEAQRTALGKLDYPIYFFDGHGTSKTETQRDPADHERHKIGMGGPGVAQYERAEKLGVEASRRPWGPAASRLPQGRLVKVDQVFDTFADFETAFTNTVKHELGHMFGKAKHGKGVMEHPGQ